MKSFGLGLLFLAVGIVLFLIWPRQELALAAVPVPPIPIGKLGLPVGTFAVIEGVYHTPVEQEGQKRDFRLEIVNDKQLPYPIEIAAAIPPHKMIPGKRYVLHGFEEAIWEGAPLLPPGGSDSLPGERLKQPSGPFSLWSWFEVTSVEKEDGVLCKNARPVNASFSLAEPTFGPTRNQPPAGTLGLPLGTYMTMTVGAPRGPTHGIECEVLAINGQSVKRRTTIGIPYFKVPEGHEQFVLHGFESGAWHGAASLPASETAVIAAPSMTSGPDPLCPDPPRSFYYNFIVTNWDKF